MFYKYTDTGEKVGKIQEVNGRRQSLRTKERKNSQAKTNGEETITNGHKVNRNSDTNKKEEQLTNNEYHKQNGANADNTNMARVEVVSPEAELGQREFCDEDEEDDELKQITELNTLDVKTPDVNEVESFRKLDVSPIPTPTVLRPVTREQSRHSLSDRVSAVLQGQVHRNCLPESKVIQIYVCSTFYGMESKIVLLSFLLLKFKKKVKLF